MTAPREPDATGPFEVARPDPATLAACHLAELEGIRAQFPHYGRGITCDEDGMWRCRSGGEVIAEAEGMGELHFRLLKHDRERDL